MNDLISRQAAIEAINKYACNTQRIYEAIKTLPSAQPYSDAELQKMQELEQAEIQKAYELGREEGQKEAQPEPQWMPCGETIDIPDHEVLCCDRYGEELIGWLSYNDDQWLCEADGEMMYDPIAWREKPEPYREEGEE